MLLSACLIVKNEELTLEKCLSSLKDIVDEIIVVDTGSTDKTVEIAERFTSNIYFYEWDNNFANARNESLRHASGDYVLIIDADEYFDENTKHELRPFLEKHKISAGFLTVNNYTGSFYGKIENTPVLLLRIIKSGVYYSEAIHEQLDPKIYHSEYPVVNIPVTLNHIGYMKEIIDSKNKKVRNMTILDELLKDKPDDIFQKVNLIAEYIRSGDFNQALELVENVYMELDIANKIKNNTYSTGNEHIVARNYKFYIIALYNLGKYEKAIEIAKEAYSVLPMITEYIYLLARLYIQLEKPIEAKYWFYRCIQQGELKVTFYEYLIGSGDFLAYLGLGMVWSNLGDEQVALNNYLQSFFRQPMISSNVMFYLVYLLPKDSKILYDYIESRICDTESYHIYAEACANFSIDDSIIIIERAEGKYGKSLITERARMAIHIRENTFDTLSENNFTPYHHLWFGIYYADKGMVEKATYHLTLSEELGHCILTFLTSMTQEKKITIPISPYARDLIAMDCTNLFKIWAPYAPDIKEAWLHFEYSPFHDLLFAIDWPGETVNQCQINVQNSLREKDINKAQEWLHRALSFPSTVTKILLEADLWIANQNMLNAIKILTFGKIVHDESIAIDNALIQLTGSKDALTILKSIRKTRKLEDLLMNPLDAYRKNVVDTMPLNIQLAQLHLRGAALTKQAKTMSEMGNIIKVRENIDELQEILTFLRSSLNPTLEISVQTDETYLFYYKMLIRWFLSPTEVPEEFDAFIEFWESWAKTWAKAQVK